MNFKLITSLVENIILSIENTAIAAVNAIRTNLFKVKVSNFPKTQSVKGTVTVANQKNVEVKLKDMGSTLKDLKKAVISFKAPSEIKVSNFPTPEKFPEFPKFPDFPEFPEFPKSFSVDNQPLKELKDITSGVKDLKSVISKLKFDPKINVQAPKPEKVVVPPANVMVTQQEIDYEKLAKLLAEQIPSLDYKKLADTLAKEMGQMVITSGGGGGGGTSFKDENGDRAYGLIGADRYLQVDVRNMPVQESVEYVTQDVDNTTEGVTYVGSATSDGVWIIQKIENESSFRYITGTADYSTNWDNRATLTYKRIYEL